MKVPRYANWKNEPPHRNRRFHVTPGPPDGDGKQSVIEKIKSMKSWRRREAQQHVKRFLLVVADAGRRTC